MKKIFIALISVSLSSCYVYDYQTVNSPYNSSKQPVTYYQSKYKWQPPNCQPYKNTYSHGCKHCEQGIPHNWCSTGQRHHNGLYHEQSRRMGDYRQHQRRYHY